VLKEYPRTLVIPETMYTLAEVNLAEGKKREAIDLFRQLAAEYGFTEWGRRATQRLRVIVGGEDVGRGSAQR
jgi:TolA-binding protein